MELIIISIFIISGNDLLLGNDLPFHRLLVEHPLSLLTGHSQLTQYPVLLGIVLLPAKVISYTGLDLGISFQIFFTFLGGVAATAFDTLTSKLNSKIRVASTIFLVPWLVIISTIMVQEDVVGILFILGILVAKKYGKLDLEILMASLGIIFAKLFFIFILIVLLAIALQEKKISKKLFLFAIIGPLIAGFSSIQATAHGMPEFWAFALPSDFSINIWALVSADFEIFQFLKMKSFSTFLMFSALIFLILSFKKSRSKLINHEGALLVLGLSIITFLYNVQPEYLFLILPILVISTSEPILYFFTLGLFPISIFQNTILAFYNRNQIYNSDSKRMILNRILEYLPFLSQNYLHILVSIVFTLLSITCLVYWYKFLQSIEVQGLRSQDIVQK